MGHLSLTPFPSASFHIPDTEKLDKYYTVLNSDLFYAWQGSALRHLCSHTVGSFFFFLRLISGHNPSAGELCTAGM